MGRGARVGDVVLDVYLERNCARKEQHVSAKGAKAGQGLGFESSSRALY